MRLESTLARFTAIGAVCTLLLTASATFLFGDQHSAAAESDTGPRVAFFYVPPKDGTPVRTLASSTDFMILNGDKQSYHQELLDNGFSGNVIQYLLAAEVGGPGPYRNRYASCDYTYQGLQNNVVKERGEFCRYVHPNESWFLHNSRGERLYSMRGSRVYYHMNPASSGWRAFARDRMKEDINTRGFDGIFLDNVSLSITKAQKQLSNSTGAVQEFSSNDSYRSAWTGYLSVLSSNLRTNGKVLWANMITDPNDGSSWDAYLPYLDGGMNESWATGYSSRGLDADKWENNLRQTERALDAGKGVIALGQGSRSDYNRQTFHLASFLLIDRPSEAAYMRYGKDGDYDEFWWYSNYELQLGAPLGDRYQSGSSWKRDFQCGTVTVNPEAQTASIVPSSCTSTGSSPATPTAVAPSPTAVPPTATASPTDQPGGAAVIINGIASGQSVSGIVSIDVTTANPDEIDSVTFYVDGQWTWHEGVAPYFLGGDEGGVSNGFDSRKWADGPHSMTVKVTGHNGSVQYGVVYFSVSNNAAPAPTATATAPQPTATPPDATPSPTATTPAPTPTASPEVPASDSTVIIMGIEPGVSSPAAARSSEDLRSGECRQHRVLC
ncbi:MAG: putative glycoside hydrolase [Thermomicrobiales bacterium]